MLTLKIAACASIALVALGCSHDAPPPQSPTSNTETTLDPPESAEPNSDAPAPSNDGSRNNDTPTPPDPVAPQK